MRRIIPLLLGLPVLALLLTLGFWQLERADEKRTLADSYASAAAADAISITTPDALSAVAPFSRVIVEGRFIPERQVLLDAQTNAGRVGYRVWTPFELDGGGWIIVDRGWVSGGADRTTLPVVAVGGEARTIAGVRASLPEPGLRLGEPDSGSGPWPRRLVWPDADVISEAWGRVVPDALLLLAPGEGDGYVRDWNPVVMPAERHVGYAVQWFALAAALVVIALVLLRRNRRNG